MRVFVHASVSAASEFQRLISYTAVTIAMHGFLAISNPFQIAKHVYIQAGDSCTSCTTSHIDY